MVNLKKRESKANQSEENNGLNTKKRVHMLAFTIRRKKCNFQQAKVFNSGVLKNAPPVGKIPADVIWGKKYEKGKRKRGKM